MVRHAVVSIVILLVAGFSGCSKEAPEASSKASETAAPQAVPAPSAAPAPAATPPPAAAPATAALKTEDTNVAGVTAEVTECARKDGVLSVKVRFHNTSGEQKKLNFFDGRDYDKYYLTAGSKKYFILKDTEGTYLTPQASAFGGLAVDLDAGGQYTWWAKYPAPPADVKAVTLYTQVAAPLDDIPVSDQ